MTHHDFLGSTTAGVAGFSADVAWAEETQRTIADHLEALSLEMDDIDTASGAPYCGCTVCITRELLYLLIPRVLRGALEGRVQLI